MNRIWWYEIQHKQFLQSLCWDLWGQLLLWNKLNICIEISTKALFHGLLCTVVSSVCKYLLKSCQILPAESTLKQLKVQHDRVGVTEHLELEQMVMLVSEIWLENQWWGNMQTHHVWWSPRTCKLDSQWSARREEESWSKFSDPQMEPPTNH